MPETIADLFVTTLVDAGVQRVWGLPGDSLNGFTDALRRSGRIQWMHTRHEEAAAFAAAGEAHVSGELAVVAGSCGPGNLHFINGLFDAQRSRVPVLAIASHIPSAEIGSSYFQETHPQELFRECSDFVELVSDPAQIPWVLERAMRTAVEKRGVAVVVVPGDVFHRDAPKRRPSAPIRPTRPQVVPHVDELRAAAELLNDSRTVTILAGAGTEGAHAEVLALAEALQAPIVHAYRGKEHIEYDNPFDVGMTGLLGFASGYRAMERCDTLLILGSDFPYREFYPKNATVIQVELRGENLGRRTPLDLGLVGDVKATSAALRPLIRDGRSSAHLQESVDHYTSTRRKLDELAVDDGKSPIHPQFLAKLVDDIADEDAIFTADVGSPVLWSARYLRMTPERRLIGSFNHGSMANAISQAMGAKASNPNQQVIALAGDGGTSMLLGELLSLRQNDLPVKVVVFNNSSLNFVELEMKAAGTVTFGTDLVDTDFAALARAAGIAGYRIGNPGELESTLRRALDEPGPALVDVVVARQELAIPPSITAAQAKGFALYALRTVLSGRGDELIDLADTNVWRRLLH